MHRWNHQRQRYNGFWNCDAQDSTSSKPKCLWAITIIAWFHHPEVSCIITGILNIFVTFQWYIVWLCWFNLLIVNLACVVFSMIFISHFWRGERPPPTLHGCVHYITFWCPLNSGFVGILLFVFLRIPHFCKGSGNYVQHKTETWVNRDINNLVYECKQCSLIYKCSSIKSQESVLDENKSIP